jgi:hypothetical protein
MSSVKINPLLNQHVLSMTRQAHREKPCACFTAQAFIRERDKENGTF